MSYLSRNTEEYVKNIVSMKQEEKKLEENKRSDSSNSNNTAKESFTEMDADTDGFMPESNITTPSRVVLPIP